VRFVVAIVLFIAAAACIGAGVAQRTVWAAPDELTLTAQTDEEAPATVIDGAALNALDGRQSIVIGGDGEFTAAYGRTADVAEWLGDAGYHAVTYDADAGALVTETVDGSETSLPALAGADLWLGDYTETDRMTFDLDVPADYSIIVEADGTAPAPTDISVTWPVDNSTPWSTPLILIGLGLVLLGFIALIWAFVNLRRARGPRRRQPRLPRPPRAQRYRPRARIGAGSRRRSLTRALIALPVALLGAGLVSGPALAVPDPATSSATPTESPAPTPSTTPTPSPGADIAEELSEEESADDATEPAVTPSQIRRILTRVSESVAAADAARDGELAAERLTGEALQARQAAYTALAANGELAAPAPVPATAVLSLPQQGDVWPRTIFAVVQDEAQPDVAPTALVLEQADARSDYQATYVMQLEPNTVLPDVAPTAVGAPVLRDDERFLSVAPRDLAAQYADVLVNGANSQYASTFDLADDGLMAEIGPDRKAERKAGIPSTASLEFSDAPGDGEVISYATDATALGAIVAVSVDETETIKPVQPRATVSTSGPSEALLGKTSSEKGIVSVYGVQLLFYVPSVDTAGDPQPVRLLGYSSSLVSSTEVP
jgi:hypothetical protein